MLLTDRDCITIDDVLNYESDIGDIALSESIPTEGDASFIHLAVEEVGNTLLGMMQNFAYPYGTSVTLPANGMYFPASDSTPGARIRLGQIVVDSESSSFASPLKKWIIYTAIRNFYRIAGNRLLNDRYDKKKSEYQSEIDRVLWPSLKACGLPICWAPVPCPGAKYEIGQGIWSSSNVTEVAGTATGGNYDVAITWVGQAESAPSQTITMTVDPNNVLKLDITSLVAPVVNGTAVTSWKVYAGLQGQSLYYQTTLPVATKTYTFTGDPLLSGTIVGTGQPRDVNLTFINMFVRA